MAGMNIKGKEIIYFDDYGIALIILTANRLLPLTILHLLTFKTTFRNGILM